MCILYSFLRYGVCDGLWVSAFQPKEVPQGIFEYSQRAQNVLKYVFNSRFIKALFFRAKSNFRLDVFQPTSKKLNLLFFSSKRRFFKRLISTKIHLRGFESSNVSFDCIIKES